jgi:DNA-binding SARP family transcriptional activator
VEFRLLGPVEFWAEGLRRDLGTAKERLVLAVLLLSPGRPVTTETLIDRVWDTEPPAKPRQSLHSYVARLRVRLAKAGGAELKSRSGGYVLEVDEKTIDVHRFRHLRAQARAIAESGDDEQAMELYRTAAQLWRAEPLADLSGDWVDRTRRSISSCGTAAMPIWPVSCPTWSRGSLTTSNSPNGSCGRCSAAGGRWRLWKFIAAFVPGW